MKMAENREFTGSLVSGRTRAGCSGIPLRALAQAVPPHDFQQARVIGEAEGFGGLRDMPPVLVERGEHDLPFGLRLQRFQRSGIARGVGGIIPILTANVGRHFGGGDDRAGLGAGTG